MAALLDLDFEVLGLFLLAFELLGGVDVLIVVITHRYSSRVQQRFLLKVPKKIVKLHIKNPIIFPIIPKQVLNTLHFPRIVTPTN